MSTPIKPPGSPPPAGGTDPTAGAVESRPGELDELVESAGPHSAPPAARAGRLEGVRADLAAGKIGVGEAIDRLVAKAMSSARGLPAADRAALEAQLRAALEEDPTLLALRKDLERA